MALIWRTTPPPPHQHRSCILWALRFEASTSQITVLWPRAFVFLSVFLPAPRRKYLLWARMRLARTISVSKEKRRDVEFISMVPITAAEERGKWCGCKGMYVLVRLSAGGGLFFFWLFVCCSLSFSLLWYLSCCVTRSDSNSVFTLN